MIIRLGPIELEIRWRRPREPQLDTRTITTLDAIGRRDWDRVSLLDLRPAIPSKGGRNTEPSQVRTRPAPPEPLRHGIWK